ncbi:F-box domain-containing protein [Stagonosporopsis vannaccii]|nr:F-box domain-containing protein [Stagonosporopsis vannaccii]
MDSFFGNNPEQTVHSTSPQVWSRASSSGSRLESSVQGSVPSLDLISPGIFLFSGPRLRSAGSHNNPASKLPSLGGLSCRVHIPRNRHSDSFSNVDFTSVEEYLLEPTVDRGVVQSMSNVLLDIKTPIEEPGDPLFESPDNNIILLHPSEFPGDDPSNQTSRQTSSPTASDLFQSLDVTALVLHFSDTTTWKIIRLVCRSWCNTISHVAPPPAGPASRKLPTEILLSIYDLLDAKDFNASRRTCRSWMIASLNESLLSAMLHRGGWHGGRPAKHDGLSKRYTTAASSEEWRLSRYLSLQCATSAGWTGNGLDEEPAIMADVAIDFTDLADGYSLRKGRSVGALIFTSSICGQYLLVANNTLIYIYSLNNRRLEPISCVVCPRRVLAMSMNASVGRDAIAALLEGRMGMLCELELRPQPFRLASRDTCVGGDGYSPRSAAQPSTSTRQSDDFSGTPESAEHTSCRVHRTFPYRRDIRPASFDTIELHSHNHAYDLRDTDDISTHDRNLINQAWNLTLRGPLRHPGTTSKIEVPVQNIPIESGTSTFYRHLCSEDDPPRNVSICPQRQCVAFGCSAGIELHWIDALSRQSLSRWFPLTSPSDHLYFLSPRPGFESAKKLRLISSATHPNNRPAISRRLFNSTGISSLWDSFGYESRSRQFHTCDHYHAIPLSDGYHVLFIDPSTERLTLGCDAPFGGPARLLRKVVLNSPEGRSVPRVYTAAADMSSGARIVAVFETTIMLYSIPPDVLALSRFEQASESLDVHNTPPFSSTGRHHDHWLNWWNKPINFGPANRSDAGNDNLSWPISLSGTQISIMSDVCELAIQTRPDLLIWAFTYTAQCKTWRLRNYVDPVVRSNQYVDRSGMVHESCNMDETRDIVMQDTLFTAVESSGGGLHDGGDVAEANDVGAFDGHLSGVLKKMPGALAVENDMLVDMIDVAGCADAWFEGDGDIVTWHEV